MRRHVATVMATILLMGSAVSCVSSGKAAKATLRGTGSYIDLGGEIHLWKTPGGLRMMARVKNVPPGQHGLHIHERGDCGDGGTAAGGHYNPAGVPHGFLPRDGAERAHAGDAGNIEVGFDGRGSLDTELPGLTLSGGKYPVNGRAFILHAGADDLQSQPTGAAGARIGCGIITLE